MRTLQEGLW